MHRRTLKMLLLPAALVLLVSGLAAACGNTTTATTTGAGAGTSVTTYLDPDYGYSFDYPSTWKLVDSGAPDVTSGAGAVSIITVGDPNGAKVDGTGLDLMMVQIYKLSVTFDETMMPDALAALEPLMADLQSQDPTWKVEQDLTETTLSGAPGYVAKSSFEWEDGTPVKTTSYFIFSGNIEYQLVLQAASESWQNDQAVFDAFLASFKPGPAA
jgi:hypothetical protein